MSLEILVPIQYGSQDRVIYDLKVGDILPNNFFLPKEKERLLSEKAIQETSKKPNISPKGEKLEELTDLSGMKLVEAKEFLEDEYNIVKLEKYFDQESNQKSPRKKLLAWIEKKSNELTGFEAARVK